MKLSIIIPHFNGTKILTKCLESLSKCTYKDVEILVVDNGSTDDSINAVKKKFSTVEIITSDTNRGYAGGCNFGAESANGEYLLFLNNDTIHQKDWLEPLIQKLDDDVSISSVQPKILNYHEQKNFDYAGASGGYMDIFTYPFSRGRVFDTIEEDSGQYDDSVEIFWASGTAFITRKLVFEIVGGFDETLFAHMEEIDYHWRCHLMGYSVWVEPKSVIHHMGGATLAYGSPEKTYLNHRNSILLMLTNYSFFVSIYLFVPRLVMEVLSLLKYAFSSKLNHAWAQLRALWWILVHPHIIGPRRWKTWKLRKVKDSEILKKLHPQSIVWQYFAQQLKTYDQLKGAK
ncbi:MAG: glycosyltransferase family 2 protein [Candidatus Marinimicrobia bacterium]|nr:glycosyltransferase family 2 protein [Candidatus Neomarinimicrobiota bacterium]MBT6870467.1 glycosyltransferase family 2 protein [Candidatus Neomarinimicrobiota bacterium]